jgi:hypothetical protein
MDKTNRIGNIEYRLATSNVEKNQHYIEIVCWCPNSLYGKENEFEKSNISDSCKANGVLYDDECFKQPEICYTVATIKIKDNPNIISCGLRAFQLNEQDEKDFKLVVRYAYQYANKLWKGYTVKLV